MANKISFYFDEMMPRKVAEQLQKRGFEVVMAVDVEMVDKDDLLEHLQYATEHNLTLVTQDRPFAGRATELSNHTGVICWTGKQNDIGGMVTALDSFAEDHRPEESANSVFWLK